MESVRDLLSTPDSCSDAADTDPGWEFETELLSESGGQHSSLRHVFRKHVKPKKQYEMCRMAKLVSNLARLTKVDKVLDIGSGVGHLSRYLAYNSQLKVACVDANSSLTTSASKFDTQLEASVTKMKARGDTSLNIQQAGEGRDGTNIYIYF